jgi:hypothetical protein
METKATDWVVVQAYLQQHGQATHRELLDALACAGIDYNRLALLMRLNRWERRGRVVVQRFADSTPSLVRLAKPHLIVCDTNIFYDVQLDSDLDVCGDPRTPSDNNNLCNGNDSQLQLPIQEDQTMPIIVRAQSYEPLPTGEYRVELTAIEEVDTPYGKQFKWTFRVPDEERTLTAYSSISASVKSKCMQWAGALLNRNIQADDEVDFEKLIGKSATAVVVRKRKDDGTEYNTIDDLHPLRKRRVDEEDPFA